MKVAVVRNRKNAGVISRFGQVCPEVYGRKSVQRVLDALRLCGHTVGVFEGDKNLLAEIEQFMPPDASGRPGGLVFNMAYGIQGAARYTHVPAMLEMAGVPYTGADPLGQAVSLDKVVAKELMRQARIPTPDFRVARLGDADGMAFPLIVKPRHESTSYGLRRVADAGQLADAVAAIVARYQQDALVETYVQGREFCVGLLGNDPVEILPIVEMDFGGRDLRAVTWEDKYHKRQDEPEKRCPANLAHRTAEQMRQIALATFHACHCRDYARVDVRLGADGRLLVLEINSMASLGAGGSYVLAAREAGYDFQALVGRILDVAHERYFGRPAPRDGSPPDSAEKARASPVSVPVHQDPKGPGASRPSGSSGGAGGRSVRTEVSCGGRSVTAVLSADRPAFSRQMPMAVTPFYQRQIEAGKYWDQLRRIVEPTDEEADPAGALDTSGEAEHTVMPGLQHKYAQTAVVLATERCFSYCRFCFRKRLLGTGSEIATDYAAIAEYVRRHEEVNNVLVTGGDPFTLSTRRLAALVEPLLAIPHVTSLRFGTKAIVNCPRRIGEKALRTLMEQIIQAGKVALIMAHVDHVGEVSAETAHVVAQLRASGIQPLSQTVLLRGVNDDVDVLTATFEKLHSTGIRPYYLFQARPVRGATHFQVPLERAVRIVHAVKRRLSGIQKTFHFVMSHRIGKIEILDVSDDGRLIMSCHQSTDPTRVGRIFTRPCPPDARWLDDLPAE